MILTDMDEIQHLRFQRKYQSHVQEVVCPFRAVQGAIYQPNESNNQLLVNIEAKAFRGSSSQSDIS